jgi:hypothetical protein
MATTRFFISLDEEGSSDACVVCYARGDTLVLCEGHQCPASVHLSCVGLDRVPKNKYLCPCCDPRNRPDGPDGPDPVHNIFTGANIRHP